MNASSPKRPARQDWSAHAFSMLQRYQIDITPIHFELMYEIVSGSNPELRQRFTALGRSVSREDMDGLAREFLPHHFGESQFDGSTKTVRGELANFRQLLVGGGSSLRDFNARLSTASDRFARIDPTDTASIQVQIEQITKATAEHTAKTGAMMASVERQIADVDSLAEEMDDVARMRFIHPATGLGNRRAFYKRMADLYKTGRFPGDHTLILARIAHLEVLDRPELLKAKEFVLERLGNAASQRLGPEESGYWLEESTIGFLISAVQENLVRDFTTNFEQKLAATITTVRRTAPGLPEIFTAFGCASTYSAPDAAALIRNTETALEAAKRQPASTTIFFAATQANADGRDYALYGRGELTL